MATCADTESFRLRLVRSERAVQLEAMRNGMRSTRSRGKVKQCAILVRSTRSRGKTQAAEGSHSHCCTDKIGQAVEAAGAVKVESMLLLSWKVDCMHRLEDGKYLIFDIEFMINYNIIYNIQNINLIHARIGVADYYPGCRCRRRQAIGAMLCSPWIRATRYHVASTYSERVPMPLQD